jgi:hypothetical protein
LQNSPLERCQIRHKCDKTAGSGGQIFLFLLLNLAMILRLFLRHSGKKCTAMLAPHLFEDLQCLK